MKEKSTDSDFESEEFDLYQYGQSIHHETKTLIELNGLPQTKESIGLIKTLSEVDSNEISKGKKKNVHEQRDSSISTKSQKFIMVNFLENSEKISNNLGLNEIIEKIKEYYESKDTFQIELFEGETMSIVDGYIRLALVKGSEQNKKEKEALKKDFHDHRISTYEDIYGTKNSIEIGDLFKKEEEEKEFNSILLLGRAGIGKSTVCQYIAYHWAKGNLFNDKFKILLWIPLRNLLNKSYYPINTDISMAEVVFKECLKKDKNGNNPFNKDNFKIAFDSIKEEILYVLDGYDEVAHIEQQAENTPQRDIIKLLLSQKNIILTSRPHYMKQDFFSDRQNKNPRVVENIGFLDEDIEKYIDIFFKNSQNLQSSTENTRCLQGLKNFLNTNKNAQGMAHIPINLALICRAWNTHYEKIKYSKISTNITLTILYSELLNDLCARYIKKYMPNMYNPLSNTNYIEDSTDCTPILNILKVLAFEKMKEGDLIIEQNQIYLLTKNIISTDKVSFLEKLLNFGLIKAIEPGKKGSSYYFIHLTFQEFFAACYIADALKNDGCLEMGDFIMRHKYHPSFEIVWWFVSGILKSTPKILEKSFGLLEDRDTQDIAGLTHQCLMIRCMEECELNVENKRKNQFFDRLNCLIKSLFELADSKKWLDIIFSYLAISNLIFNSPEVIKLITHYLKNEKREIRSFTAKSLAIRSSLPDTIINQLATCLKDEEMGRDAADALGSQPHLPEKILEQLVECLKLKENLGSIKLSAAHALSNCTTLPAKILDQLINYLADKSATDRDFAIVVLGAQSDLTAKILEQIINCLKDEDEYVRSYATKFLAEKNPNLSTETIEQLASFIYLKDKGLEVMAQAKKALCNQSGLPRNILEKFLTCITDTSFEYLPHDILETQSNLGSKIPEQLIKCLNDKDESLRCEVASILSHHSGLPNGILEALAICLQDKNESVREAATRALARDQNLPIKILTQLIISLKKEGERGRHIAAYALSNQLSLPEEILELIINCLKDENEYIRSAAVTALGNPFTWTKEILYHIVEAVKDKSDEVRIAALTALSRQSNLSEKILNQLVNCLRDQNRSIRLIIVNVLGNQQGLSKEILMQIVSCLKDEDTYVRSSAAEALDKQYHLSEKIFGHANNCLKHINFLKSKEPDENKTLNKEVSISYTNTSFDEIKTNSFISSFWENILSNSSNLPENNLEHIVNCLQYRDIFHSAKIILNNQSNLSKKILALMTNYLKDENARSSAEDILQKKPDLPEKILEQLANYLTDENMAIVRSATEILDKQSISHIIKLYEKNNINKISTDYLITILTLRISKEKISIYFHEKYLHIGNFKVEYMFLDEEKNNFIESFNKCFFGHTGIKNLSNLLGSDSEKLSIKNYGSNGLFGGKTNTPVEKHRLALNLSYEIFNCPTFASRIKISLSHESGLAVAFIEEFNPDMNEKLIIFTSKLRFESFQLDGCTFKIFKHTEVLDFIENHCQGNSKLLYEEEGVYFNFSKMPDEERCSLM